MFSNTGKITKQASVINRAEVKRRLLQHAKDKRAHVFSRVSEKTLLDIEAVVEAFIRRHVEYHPSKGVTL